jgi:hypothetical protein
MSVYFPNIDPNLLVKKPHQRNADTKFPWKLHRMLKDVEQQGLTHIVGWHDDGLCFKVHDPDAFVKKVLPLHFKESKWRSFQRQLNLYGFQRITAVKPIWDSCYYHAEFQREVCEGGCPKVNRPLRKNLDEKKRSSIGSDEEGTEEARGESVGIVDLDVPRGPSPTRGAAERTGLPSSGGNQSEATTERRAGENFDVSSGLSQNSRNEIETTATGRHEDDVFDTKLGGPEELVTLAQCHDQGTVHSFLDISSGLLDESNDYALDDEELFERIDGLALTRRDSYQDLCESILGPTCRTSTDYDKLMVELLTIFPTDD